MNGLTRFMFGIVLMTGCLAIVPSVSMADSNIAVRVEAAHDVYSFRTTPFPTGVGFAVADTKYQTLTVGTTWFASNRIAVDAYYKTPITKGDNAGSQGDLTFDRTEFNLSLAYAMTPNLGVFVGWRMFDMAEKFISFDPGIPNTDVKFSSYGPSLGLSYGFLFNDNISNLNVMGGLTYQMGDMDFNYGIITSQEKKSGLGYSVGLKYGHVLSDHWDMNVGLGYYSMKLKGLAYADGAAGGKFDFTEDAIQALSIGVRYAF